MSSAQVGLPELLASLTRALDLTEGQPEGHTLRSCMIGMRLAESIDIGAPDRTALLYALLLKDAGCSSNAARLAVLFGTDDHAPKRDLKVSDWQQPVSAALFALRQAGRGRGVFARLRHLLLITRSDQDIGRELIRIRCERGSGIVRELGFPEATAEAIHALDEHWNGQGHPDGLAGEEIPLLARICGLAQTTEVFHHEYGLEATVRMLRERRGRWFDPVLTDRVLEWAWDRPWWQALEEPRLAERVPELDRGLARQRVDDAGLDAVAEAFASIIDAKSSFTFRHSTNVARYASAVGRLVGLAGDELRQLHRAGLLHDIGKLGISSRILEKDGPLTPAERAVMQRHPVHTWDILSEVGAFRPFAREAALHHERLDGGGYPWGFRDETLPLSARILAVADIYEALTARRPYRDGMPHARALSILRDEAGTAVEGRLVDAIDSVAGAAPEGDTGDAVRRPLASLFTSP